jgi:hypothetical protein
MIRTVISILVVAASVAALAASPVGAQSPDPALLAPGSSRATLTPRPAIPHTGVAVRPTVQPRAEIIPRRSGLASQAHAGSRRR